MEATEAQRNTIGWRQNHKQASLTKEKSKAVSSTVTAFVKTQSKLHKCQHHLFMATKGRMLNYVEIAYLVNSCNVIKKKKFRFLSVMAYCQLKVRKNIPG